MKLLNPNSLHVILLFTITLLCLQHTTSSFIPTNEIDRLALLKFKESIDNGPFGSLISWNDSIQFCNWHGITCGRYYQRLGPRARTESQIVPNYNISRKRATYQGNEPQTNCWVKWNWWWGNSWHRVKEYLPFYWLLMMRIRNELINFDDLHIVLLVN